MTKLTLASTAVALRALAVLPNAPELDEHGFAIWFELMDSEGVTLEEFQRALGETLKRERFYPAPAVVLERVSVLRVEAYREREARERVEAQREREALVAAIAPPEMTGELAPLEGLPVPPPREPRAGKNTPTGAVRLPDGRLDPRWPEIPGREAAWRRKKRYDHSLCSYRQATAKSIDAAAKGAYDAAIPETPIPTR